MLSSAPLSTAETATHQRFQKIAHVSVSAPWSPRPAACVRLWLTADVYLGRASSPPPPLPPSDPPRPDMHLTHALPLLALSSSLVSAVVISPLYRETNAERLKRGLGPRRPSRPFNANNQIGTKVIGGRQVADPVPSTGATLSPHDIQGRGFLSSYDGKKVENLKGIVTAIG